jgi:hypothetical protein
MIPPLLLDVEPHHFVSRSRAGEQNDPMCEADIAIVIVSGYVRRSWLQGESPVISAYEKPLPTFPIPL